MRVSMLIQIVCLFFALLLSITSFALQAAEIDQSLEEEPSEINVTPNQMTKKEMNDLFGEDPYLGQTSYLQSPDSFSQKEKSK